MCKHLKYLVCIVVIMCITMLISMGVSATETISDSDYTKFVEMLKKTESGSGEDDNCNAIKLPDGSTFALFKFEKSSGNFPAITNGAFLYCSAKYLYTSSVILISPLILSLMAVL